MSARPWLSSRSTHCFIHCNKLEAQVSPAREPMLERGERPGAVGIEPAVRAVVQAENVASAASAGCPAAGRVTLGVFGDGPHARSEEHTSELQSREPISYAV